MAAKKDDWVRIHSILMEKGSRAPQVPADTAEVPFELWDKGFLVSEKAEIGDIVKIETITGRIISGNLLEINPSYAHNFGKFIPEILKIDKQLKEIMGALSNE